MRILIVEDDFIARKMMKTFLSPYGDCDVAVDGEEGVQAFRLAWEENIPYDLILMDIMMPNLNGQEALKRIREMERAFGIPGTEEVKVIMITALGDPKTVINSYYSAGATSYLVKPIEKQRLQSELRDLGLVS